MKSITNISNTTKKAFEKAIISGDPKAIVIKKLKKLLENNVMPTKVLAIGKAASRMAEAVKECKINVPGIIVTNDINFKKINGFKCFPSGHPIPDQRGLFAVKTIERFLKQLNENDHLLLLISGGGSALLPAPPKGFTLQQKIILNKILLNSGLNINKTNSIRRLFSRLKGGRLAMKAYPSQITQLLISDVPNDNLEAIASGLASPDPIPINRTIKLINNTELYKENFIKKFLVNVREGKIMLPLTKENLVFENVFSHLLASNSLCVQTIESYLSKQFSCFEKKPPKLEKEASKMGVKLAKWVVNNYKRPNSFFVTGGETTVKISGNSKTGLGGRSQELAITFATEMSENKRFNLPWALLSAGTDGQDGPTDAAGALITSACKINFSDAKKHLKNHDSYNFHRKLGTLFKINPTGTNLGDIVIVIIG